ncbi:hypothetical protein P0136_03155 [Lentisphaerota bacterium ZTH]|nr:hypothetical protein JYG24_05710 [Lentisphaerota bacterium]WET07000.1 hypothetical protein P0136_03155 [Lentisphaerota bacterium ZTH]
MRTFDIVNDKIPRINGGFIVKARTPSGSIKPSVFQKIWVDMVQTTFPYNQLTKKSSDLFISTYISKFHLIYIPSNLYSLMYLTFIHSQNIDHQVLKTINKLYNVFDARLSLAGSDSVQLNNIWQTFVERNDSENYHFARFNAWASAMISRPGFSNHQMKVPWQRGKALELSKAGLQYFTDYMLQLLASALKKKPPLQFQFESLKFSKRLINIIKDLIVLEGQNPALAFLTRFGDSNLYPTYNNNGTLEPSSYSQSFGSGIFAGSLGDVHACTLFSLNNAKNVFTLPIPITSYIYQKEVPIDIFIPPIPAILQIHAQMQELWHPRSKLYPIEREIGDPLKDYVEGITSYGLQPLNREPLMVNLQFLLYQGSGMEVSRILTHSRNFNKYIKTNKINLPLSKTLNKVTIQSNKHI